MTAKFYRKIIGLAHLCGVVQSTSSLSASPLELSSSESQRLHFIYFIEILTLHLSKVYHVSDEVGYIVYVDAEPTLLFPSLLILSV